MTLPPPYLVSEYVEGTTLATVVQRDGPLHGSELIGLAVGVAEALRAIHAAAIVHADLKPSNVVLTRTGPKIIDFGVARKADEDARGGIIGTPLWMAPEQLTGAVSLATDVHAWGSLVLFAATGRPPFPADSLPAVLARIQYDPPELEGVPSGLADLVEGAMRKDPAQRPSSREILQMLRATTRTRAVGQAAGRPAAGDPMTGLGEAMGARTVGYGKAERRDQAELAHGRWWHFGRRQRTLATGTPTDDTPPAKTPPAAAVFLRALRTQQLAPGPLHRGVEAPPLRIAMPPASSFAHFLTTIRQLDDHQLARPLTETSADSRRQDWRPARDVHGISTEMSRWASQTIEVLSIEQLFEHEAAELYREARERHRLEEDQPSRGRARRRSCRGAW